MKTRLDPYDSASSGSKAVSAALVAWYGAHSVVRRLWAIQDAQGLRVLVTLEPTHDGNDTHPAWIANSHAWAHELRLQTDPSLQLEQFDGPVFDELEPGAEGVMVAALNWRDPSII